MKKWRSKAIVKVAVTSWGHWFSNWVYITTDLQEYFIKPRLPCQQIWLSYDRASERCWYYYPRISSWESLPQVVSRRTCQMTSLSAAEKIVSSILMGVWKASTASAASRRFAWVPYYLIDFIPLSKQFDVITLFHSSEFISEMFIKITNLWPIMWKSYSSSFVSYLGDWHYYSINCLRERRKSLFDILLTILKLVGFTILEPLNLSIPF